MRKHLIILFFIMLNFSNLFAQDYQYLEYQNEQIMQTEKYQKGNNYQKDFLLLMELLQTTHPAFAPEQRHPFDIDSLIKTEYKNLESCKSLSDFRFYLSSLLVPLHDGHTFISFFQEEDMDVFYPAKIWLDENIPYIQAIEKEHETVLGKQIIAINGLSIPEIDSVFGKILIADNDYFFKEQIFEWILFPKIWNYLYKDNHDSPLHFVFYDGTSIYIEAKNRIDIKDFVFVEQQKSKSSEMTYNKGVPFSYVVLDKERLAYLQFNECIDQNAVRQYYDNLGHADKNGKFSSELEEQFQQYPKFDTLLFSMFCEINSKKIPTLVIDVRNNGGGNSELCRQLLSYLVLNIDNLKTTNSLIRISDFFIQYYPELYDLLCKKSPHKPETGKLYSDDFFSLEDEYSMNQYFKMNNDISLIFNGTTIFLQDKGTFSSAGDLLIEARDNKIGMIIGKNSTYRPCNFGDILFWELPNTKTTGGISHKYFTRPDKSKCNEEYLAPDVYIHTTFEDYKNGIDPCWEWVKNNFSKK